MQQHSLLKNLPPLDRQTDALLDRQTDRQTDGLLDRQTDRQTDCQKDDSKEQWTNPQKDKSRWKKGNEDEQIMLSVAHQPVAPMKFHC